jgi:ATP-dependent helicase HepA
LARWREQLAGASGWVARERRRIDQQDALDALGEAQSDAFDQLETVDAEWPAWRDAFDGFAIRALQFQKRLERWEDPLPAREEVFRLGYNRETGASTLMTLNAFIAEFIGTIDTEASHSSSRNPLTFAYAFRRNTALSKQGMARKIRPLRFGDALVESLYSFCESDDRGRIYAMWRHVPAYEPRDASGVDLFFRLDFLVEGDLPAGSLATGDAVRALRRRMDGHFPPQFHTVWVLPGGHCTTESPPELQTPYTKGGAETGSGRDYNLNAKRWQVLEMRSDIPWTTHWSKHCNEASAAAKTFLAQLDQVKQRIHRGLSSLRAQHDARAAQLTARATRLQGAAQETELADLREEGHLHQRLVTALGSPRFRMDAAGAVFVAPTCPFNR